MDRTTVNWIIGGLMGVFGILALAAASRTQEPVVYWTGLGFFIFCVLFDFGLIGRNVGRHDD